LDLYPTAPLSGRAGSPFYRWERLRRRLSKRVWTRSSLSGFYRRLRPARLMV